MNPLFTFAAAATLLASVAALAQRPAIVDIESGNIITVIADSHVQHQIAGLGFAWLARVEVINAEGTVIARAPVAVGGCTAGPLGPLGNMNRPGLRGGCLV